MDINQPLVVMMESRGNVGQEKELTIGTVDHYGGFCIACTCTSGNNVLLTRYCIDRCISKTLSNE